MSRLEIDDVSRRYGRRWALVHVELDIPSGTAWMLTGPNGSGKSTLLKCVATAIRAHEGTIRLGGADLWKERARLRRRIAYFGHDAQLYEGLSAQENLSVWASLLGVTVDMDPLLTRVGLDPTRHDPMRTFSAGMRRRLALARMRLKAPDLVLLDEPFSALDPDGRELMLEVATELRTGGATVLLATHMPEVARRFCTHHVALESGRVISSEAIE